MFASAPTEPSVASLPAAAPVAAEPIEPLDEVLEALITKYQMKYGGPQDWPRERALLKIAEIRADIEARDLKTLRMWVASNHNPFSRAVFERLAKVKLPKTERDTRAFLEQFVGEDALRLCREEEALVEKAKEAERLESERAAIIRRLTEGRKVRHRDEVITGSAFLDRIVADGYTSLVISKRGCAPVYKLWNRERGAYFPLRLRDERDYLTLMHGETVTVEEEQAAPEKVALAA